MSELDVAADEAEIEKYRYTLNFDGGSRGNPGPSAGGWVIKDRGETIVKGSTYLGDDVTNNQAEYEALIHGLEACKRHGITNDLLIIGDSKVVIYHVRQIWGCKNERLIELLAEAHKILENFSNYHLIHRKRRYNKEADKMVNLELRKLVFKDDRTIKQVNEELSKEKGIVKQ